MAALAEDLRDRDVCDRRISEGSVEVVEVLAFQVREDAGDDAALMAWFGFCSHLVD